MPNDLTTSVLNCTSVNISWSSVDDSITSYTLTVTPNTECSTEGSCTTSDQYYILTGLEYNNNYIISVTANNCAGPSSPNTVTYS